MLSDRPLDGVSVGPPSRPRPAPGTLEGGGERHASWLELFFDLVFVAAIAALATQLHADHSVAGLAVFAGLFVPVWWGWMGYTWYLTALAAIRAVNRRTDRIVALRLAVAGAALALAIAGLGLEPLSFTALVTILLVGEAAIELTSAPSDHGDPPPQPT